MFTKHQTDSLWTSSLYTDVVSKLYDCMNRCTIIGVQCVWKHTQNTALGNTSAKSDGRWGVGAVFTCWDWLVKKSLIQVQMSEWSPAASACFWGCLEGKYQKQSESQWTASSHSSAGVQGSLELCEWLYSTYILSRSFGSMSKLMWLKGGGVWYRTCFWKHFMMIGVRATGL